MLNFESMVCALPEDVLKHRNAGEFDMEIRLIDRLLGETTQPLLRDRLTIERVFAQRLPKAFCRTESEVRAEIAALCPDFTDEEFEDLILERAVEFIYVKGERRYLRSCVDTLLKANPAFIRRIGKDAPAARTQEDDAIDVLRKDGVLRYHFHMKTTLTVSDEAFVKNAPMLVHMALPKACAQQSYIHIHTQGASVAAENAPQRTICFDRRSSENLPFTAEFAWDNEIRYVNAYEAVPTKAHAYPNAAPVTADDLSEQLPHIAFTPYLRALCASLCADETDALTIARRIYDYITTNIRYSYMRSYLLIENQAEFCALNKKGDCGIQALLFITLCRMAGIPARWQSGLAVNARSAGCHDWAQFYVEPYGWLFCDPSYGGSAHRNGNEERRRFYFGNLDPFRMVANSRYATDFTPPKTADRDDPYDNQIGEVEIGGQPLYEEDFHTAFEMLSFSRI